MEQVSSRFFPPVAPDLYSAPEDAGPAGSLAALSRRPFSRAERLFPRRLDARGQFARLFFLHRLALEAELAGQWDRADILWPLVREQLTILDALPGGWQSVVSAAPFSDDVRTPGDAAGLRACVVAEILVDTHQALCSSYLAAPRELRWNSRAFAHLEYLLALAPAAGLPVERLSALLLPPARAWLPLLLQARQWAKALRTCRQVLALLPDAWEIQDYVGRTHWERAVAAARKIKTRQDAIREARKLGKAIDRLQRECNAYPHSIGIRDALAALHRLYAIRLSNAGDTRSSLLAAQKACAIDPTDESGQALVKQIMTTHENSLRLFDRGKTYQETQEAQRLRTGYYAALGWRLWATSGMPLPAERPDDRGLGLLSAMSEVLNARPAEAAAVRAAWQQAAARHPDVGQVDSEAICASLEKRLRGASAAESPAGPLAVPGSLQLPAKPRRGREPMGLWLFSRQDRRLKLQLAAAVVLLVLAAAMAAWTGSARAGRDLAYRQAVAAAQAGDDLEVIRASEAVFGSPLPYDALDPRRTQVVDLYARSFVVWFAGLPNVSDAAAQSHIALYRRYMGTAAQTGAGGRPAAAALP